MALIANVSEISLLDENIFPNLEKKLLSFSKFSSCLDILFSTLDIESLNLCHIPFLGC